MAGLRSGADLVLQFGGRRDVIELKLASAVSALSRGLAQVSLYARRLGRDRGHLILFDPRSDLPWEQRGRVEEVVHDRVKVVVVWA
ncbi:MAG: hypothetical protein FJ125_00235 [Deltaproteobacteria bacterium]|nr:hypothetical protein [Deltaproteobacteria bacterium]